MTDTRVRISTTMGEIVLQLDATKAPGTVANFLQYVDDGFYDGTIFHRVIDGFMIQGGGFDAVLRRKSTRAPIQNEADNGLLNVAGAVAMARTGDPHSATAQFFINVNDNTFLDHRDRSTDGWGYCVFGQVIDGMATVQAIKALATGPAGGMRDVPIEAVAILTATREKR